MDKPVRNKGQGKGRKIIRIELPPQSEESMRISRGMERVLNISRASSSKTPDAELFGPTLEPKVLEAKLRKLTLEPAPVEKPKKETVEPTAPLPGPSNAPGKEVSSSSQQAELVEVDIIKKYMNMRRALSVKKSEKPSLEMDAELVAGLIKGMACSECGKIASPYRRFICPRGHHFCIDCGYKKFKLDDHENGVGVCCKIAEPGDIAKPIRGIGYGSINPHLKLEDDEIEEWIKNMKTGRVECRLFLRKGQQDPLYNALFNNTVFNCPLKDLGCEEKVLGKGMQKHIIECLEDYDLV